MKTLTEIFTLEFIKLIFGYCMIIICAMVAYILIMHTPDEDDEDNDDFPHGAII
jgi:hypothetical protein